MIRCLLIGLLPLGLWACESAPPADAAQAYANWPDLPLPRGFEPVEDRSQPLVVEAGTYRAGGLAFRGPGPMGNVEAYYQERMPQFGWSWDPGTAAWIKGPTRVRIDITPIPTTTYTKKPGEVRLVLRVHSERSPAAG